MVKQPTSNGIYYGSNVRRTEEDQYSETFMMNDKTGTGIMVMHHVFPGIDIVFNEFNMTECISEFQSNVKLIGFDYCFEGRIEWEIGGGKYLYLKPGSIEIDTKRSHAKKFGLPLSYYRGMTVAIHMEEAKSHSNDILLDFGVDIEKLYEKIYFDDLPYITDADAYIRTFFENLDSTDLRKNHEYLKIKTLEFLTYMNETDVKIKTRTDYFPKRQVDITKKIEKFVTENYYRHYTIKELSNRFQIAETSLKSCFKGVYGQPIGSYMKEYRMNMASQMLKDTNKNILEIAGDLGYSNQSKFSAAYKSLHGISPKEYRKNN